MLEDIFNDKQPNKEDNRTEKDNKQLEKELNIEFKNINNLLINTLNIINDYNKYSDKKIQL